MFTSTRLVPWISISLSGVMSLALGLGGCAAGGREDGDESSDIGEAAQAQQLELTCPPMQWWDLTMTTDDQRYPYAHVCASDNQNYECDPHTHTWRALGTTCGNDCCRCDEGTALGGIPIDPARTTCGSTACGMDKLVYTCAADDWHADPDSHCGGWTSAGSLAQARRGHTATLLQNGKVLVAGGQGTPGFLNTAEVYDPATGTWSTTGSFANARLEHTATLLQDGRVLIAGGYATPWPLASARVYDPAAGTWSGAGSFATARYFHTATLLNDGKVLIAGGLASDSASNIITSSAQIYNPATNTWSATGSLSTARYYHTATLLPDGKVLVSGGHNGSAPVGSAEVYNPSTGTWTAAAFPARYLHTETLLSDGTVLITGGSTGANILTGTALRDPSSGVWATSGSLLEPRYTHTATLLDNGKVLIAGGRTSTTVLASTELFDPATGISTAEAPLTQNRRGHTATRLNDGHVLVVGGEQSDGGFVAKAELY